MDYTKIPDGTKKYIRKSTYIAMNKEERKIYLKMVAKLVDKLDEISNESTSSDDEIVIETSRKYTKPLYRKLNSRYIVFVGMRYRGDHRFSPDDTIKLERDDNNSNDPNAVKVMLMEGKKWRHVAYVARDDAEWLREVHNFEKLPLEWAKNTRASCTYNIDLRPLEDKGIKIKTKKDVLDRSGKYWMDGKWYEYQELVQYV
jgi:hypothetical protein